MYIWKHLLHRLHVCQANNCIHLCERCERTFKVGHSLRCPFAVYPFCRQLYTDRTISSELWFDLEKLESMNRRELQTLCKKYGIKANSKTTKLVNDLKQFHTEYVADSSSILHYPFIVPNNTTSKLTPSKSEKKTFIPNGSHIDRNLSLFSQMESTNQWISGEVGKLNKKVKAKGIMSKTVGEYKGVTTGEAKEGDATLKTHMYLARNASISDVLSCTSNKLFMISRWQKQQIETMGKEKFTEYRKALSSSGTQFHSCMKNILQGEADESGHFPASISGLIQSVQKTGILKSLASDKLLATEEYVTHSLIGYSGTFDGLAIHNGVPCVIEWKTSQKPRPTLQSCYDAPLQVVAYAGAINSHPIMRIPVTNCMIVVAHHDGSKADVHWMDLETCEKFWKDWLLKVLGYKKTTEGVSK